MYTDILEAINSTQLNRFLTQSPKFCKKVKVIDKLMEKAAKRLIGPFSIVKWASSKNGIIHSIIVLKTL